MMNGKLIIFFSCLGLSLTSAQFLQSGQCDSTIGLQTNFAPDTFLGTWYEIGRPEDRNDGECSDWEISRTGDTSFIFTYSGVVNDIRKRDNITATFETGSARFTLLNNGDNGASADFWILGTNYQDYAIAYKCENVGTTQRNLFITLLGRQTTINSIFQNTMNNIVAGLGVSLDDLFSADHSDDACFVLPSFSPGEAIVLPGQCDPNISLLSSFNAGDFVGTWYETYSYYSENSLGTCAKAEYSLGDGVVNVVNSQVVNQTLGTITGTAAVIDGSTGMLLVELQILPGIFVQSYLWVIDTDYVNYAITYSCENLTNDTKRVSAWKLSRNQQGLSAAAVTAIDTAMENIEVLDQRYFETVDQTEEGCTSLPDIAAGQPIIIDGQCDPNIQVVQNFSSSDYVGLWYLVESYWSQFQSGDCNDATYTAQADGSALVFNTQVINQTLATITGSAVVASTDGSGKLSVTFPNSPIPADYWVIDTDYTSYALVYSCINLTSTTQQIWSWKMSRTKSLTESAVTNINQAIDNIRVLNNRFYYTIDNSDQACFYYPEPNGETVIFRGQCDETIPVVTNFDAVAYMGLWYDIQSYPQRFQGGTCNTANYTLTDVVEVFNTQVVNQRLGTITGSAVPWESVDGEAKLNVTFPIGGAPVYAPYWVLATDYTDFALVYACQNVGDDQRSVSSWKLSRTKALSTQAQTTINNIIQSIDVLMQDYYEVKGHTDEDCFYFPEPEEGVPVVFPGFCDENITAVPNFDLNAFQGSWFEIETYPKDQAGQCFQHTVSGTNTLNVSSSFIEDQFLSTSSSVLTFSSTDNSGKFNVAINIDNQVIEIPFWILATDYNSYALAYSCMARENDHRAISAWKLSRNQQGLSAAAVTAIDTAMENIEVLDQRYFETVDQTEEGCTSLPDIAAGQPIIIDGQCDPNIQVVQNFSSSDYVGLWYLVESYWSQFQSGDCNDATYTAQADGSALVFNTQVINQTLATITGSAVVASTDGSGKLSVTFPNTPVPAEYWVIDTDYTSYALVYSCINLTSTTQQIWSWKMSRTKSLTETAVTNINQAIDNIHVLNNRYYYTIDNSDQACFYYPEPNGQTVTFRGQCDETIQVVTNFDAVAYMGLWYDIESYPQAFQEGTCGTANYTLTSVVDVFNTQVVNQRLDTIIGRAVPLESPDGQAKLSVSFPIEVAPGIIIMVSSPYWVLATDYTNYALVYACQNTGADQRTVSSWKLSRTKALSTQAQTSINNVIQNIDVLRQDYYEVQGHTDEDCFYFPEPEEGVPVVFPGFCDENITAVSNFDLNAFQGSWFEIETYPKDQAGQCFQHTVSGTNTLNVSSSFVENEFLSTFSSILTFSSTDNSGKFNIAINIDNQVIEIPFWILATDYNSYALAYSCMARENDHRAIYAWKLSRNQQGLSAAAVTAIDTAMENIEVLDQRYFETVDQTEEGCTSLPDIAAGQPIIIDGQCDPNIQVVQNFSSSDYVGLWYLVESYWSQFQSGDCNDATYTAQADGSALVFNTQVINQTLATITGSAVVASTDGSGKLSVTFPNTPIPADYWVIDTDYTSYALVYSCINLTNATQQIWSWKMSRTKSLTETAATNINQAIDNIHVLNNRYYYTIDNSDQACFYYPEPNGQTVTFRGQCDETIQVVTNFDAVAYMGLWYDIESYPQAFQEGTCGTANYTLTSVVDVFNTQVVNQRLDTIIGWAVPLESTDGQAKLSVSFPIEVAPGIIMVDSSPYWVLATDYTNYALVYACQNTGAHQRTVSSWKLSRTKALSTEAQTSINNVIQNIDVLRQDYYEIQGHTDEDCFYFPEPEEGVPVVFPGFCDENITAVPNFDLNAFQGSWFEIETYPKDQAGQCFQHTVSGTNTLNVSSSFIEDQFLLTSSSVLTFSSTDNSGKFNIAINIDNQVIEIPFWILATDYNSYALAYSCMARENDYRAIYAWKLSRNQQGLLAAAVTAIDTAMENIEVLDQRYFETVDQTEEGCTSLPDIAAGQPIIIDGQCDPNIQVVQNFSSSDYVGLWYLVESYWSQFQSGDCNDATYTAQADGSALVFNTQVINQTLATITGSAVVASTDGSGKLSVTFPNTPIPADYWVIDTDYTSYALVYSCINLTSTTQQIWSWKMSRTKSLTESAVTNINQAIDNIRVLNNRFYYTIDNSDQACFYYPEPNGETVIFRGQCDETIPVVTNFDAVAYMGLWYDIQSYPQRFQGGTCNTANYTLTDVVEVFNTQVVNQRLGTITGSAVPLESVDGEAKLNVTFPIGGAPVYAPYWVLATDYTDFALVYACQNVGDDQRSVSSWKLSRTKALSTQAQTTINNIIQSIDVLMQDYYEVKGHTDEDCFYFPEPEEGVPVVFPGFCDENITAVPNFDLNAFQGSWFEIETYPKDQAGQCFQHTVSGTNTLNVSSSFIEDQFLSTSSSVLTFSSTDNSGKFNVAINIDNQVIEIPFWILATDYNSYALAYSCMARENDHRAISAWKLSRNQQGLSAAAVTAIDTAMENIEVLDQRYFETVDQTEEGCTSLPDIAAGQPIIIDGQCDPNIQVVQNFSSSDYVGLWYLVESYWSQFQSGDCNDATYTAQADGSALVFNTQVINQTLATITGSAVVASTDGSGKLSVTFPNTPIPADYWVIDTDYTSYALVYSCINLTSTTQQIWSWKMSRTKSLTESAVTNINQAIDNIRVLNNRFYYTIDNSDQACFYYPEPNGETVIFRGQCDETIPVVTNFDAVAYMGLWYDIQSYPQRFQGGTCNTANYTLTDVVEVFNTQVVNQRLGTITGSAVPLESVDGEAKLNVTFPIGGAPVYAPYWVLATDYTDFALVYACQNVGDDQRSVSSWKLSRTKALSTQAQTTINNIIQSIDVLMQDYYEVKGHTDEDCFYYPEPTGEPVVFRGQCDNTIQALPNFDLDRFTGTWNEIETYPKDQAGGQCIHHEFTANASSTNTLQLVSNQVFNSETLVTNAGQIVLDSTDGSGRFLLTMDVDNLTIAIPYWIIDTDYTDYALVYSCMNRDAETRAVYSWKLSRSSDLSSSGNTFINTAIATIDVLEQEYYEPVSQTAAACFYLPDEINPNEPAIFTGQCDTTIPVKENFDSAQFSGRWFDIESYFDGYTGSCIDGTFNQNGNGYDVILTQVVNQTLNTTISTASLSTDNTGKLIVTTNGVQYEYWILDTDYVSWALIYSCENVNTNQRRVRSWKMSRMRQLSTEANTAIDAIIGVTGELNQQFYLTRDHSNAGCFYYPVPDGNPVTFRGRCNESIAVVQNFDIAAYLGQWYDIESYPQLFQNGECATALYTLGADGVDVYNTQVVNRQLEVINGLAVVATDDGSAKLSVSFNGFLSETPYWVLDTDYTSYSLVYSCSEIDEEYKRVSAWKLSRTRNLTTLAEQQINQVMNSVPVLQQEYFRQIGHSDEDCFVYPDNNGGSVIFAGQCRSSVEIATVTNFNLSTFSGTWYDVSRFPSEEQTGECASGEFSVTTSNSVSITHNIVNNERLVVTTGSGTTPTDGKGVITASLSGGQLFITIAANLNLYILDTDYNEFALLYACRNIDTARKQIYSWKLSRSQSGLSQAANERIDAAVSSNEDLFEQYYESTAQTNAACFYYPEYDVLPGAIELPGPCNDTIRGIPGFNAEAYLGRWFEISRYPQLFQFGTCDQATYSLGNGVVDVYNTQVVNRTLLTQEGFAEVASTDGTGQLQVTFDVDSFTNIANYYIMATDYTSYSLVYSCRDLDNGNRQVYSWKLSRDRTLSNVANQAMDAAIVETQGLIEDYYVPTSQTDEDCFYVPEPNPDSYVTFRGQCEDISGVQNFNIQNYLGTWHEVERYPTGQNDGVCISADFRSSGTQFQVVDTSVFDVTADIATSTIQVTTNGRITRTSGQSTTDVWVLATDYDSYALLYSCENINDEYRRVWSAKHSRTRSLSASAEAAIAGTLASSDLLYQQHYVQVDQSDDACFYYPEVMGGPVVLPGQCDLEISVVENFVLDEYTGTWYQIERYPQMWETGNCTGARYSIDEETGVVNVINWEVIEGELDTIEGTAAPSSDDSSAKFVVTLPSRAEGAEEGDTVEMELYVLRTDYLSYALVYSCVNINEYQRQLGVWKLSRTREMLASGTTEINSYIATRPELDQRYFIAVGQDDDCPEPSGGFLVKSSIILLLVCSVLQLFK